MTKIIHTVLSSLKVKQDTGSFKTYSLSHYLSDLNLVMDRNFECNENRWGIGIIHCKKCTFIFCFPHFGSLEAICISEVWRTGSMNILYASYVISWWWKCTIMIWDHEKFYALTEFHCEILKLGTKSCRLRSIISFRRLIYWSLQSTKLNSFVLRVLKHKTKLSSEGKTQSGWRESQRERKRFCQM